MSPVSSEVPFGVNVELPFCQRMVLVKLFISKVLVYLTLCVLKNVVELTLFTPKGRFELCLLRRCQLEISSDGNPVRRTK